MQFVVAVPEFAALVSYRSAAEMLMRPVCGIPLLVRTLVTAARAGADEILFVWPEGAPEVLAKKCMESDLVHRKVNVKLMRVKNFDPGAASSWASIQDDLEVRFVWLPWNWVAQKKGLRRLSQMRMGSVDWHKPACIARDEIDSSEDCAFCPPQRTDGIAVISPATAAAAEQFLVAYSGKVLDGVHSSFNRRLCRPWVRLISHIPISPNEISVGGVLLAAFAGIAFAQGAYWSDVVGALLFFVAGLFDEMDGMVARIKFAESPFGTWLEGFADGLSYLLLFGGITIGLYHRQGRLALLIGAALLAG